MRSITNNKSTMFLITALTLLIPSAATVAYPPDNAAVLYYRACQWHQSDPEMEQMLTDLSKGKIEINERIEKYVQRNRRSIGFVLDASEAKDCDWGMDYSKGIETVMPPLHMFRKLAWLIMADAKILAAQGDCEAAIGRCLSLHKFARHVSDRTLLMHLVGIAINDISNKCIQDILSESPANLETLSWLKNQILEIENIPLSFKACIDTDRDTVMAAVTEDNIEALSHIEDGEMSPSVSKAAEKWFLAADEQFLPSNRAYWKEHYGNIKATLDMPYTKAYAELKRLRDKPGKDIIENSDATLTTILLPAFDKVYGYGIRGRTLSNAVKAAIDIYIVKAKTGRLPEKLPAGLPKDLFSGKNFEYEKTKDGFLLRCRGKDLHKDKTYQYEFKIPK